jgi:hypothetical protein
MERQNVALSSYPPNVPMGQAELSNRSRNLYSGFQCAQRKKNNREDVSIVNTSRLPGKKLSFSNSYLLVSLLLLSINGLLKIGGAFPST